jgi:AcrR family transcriptional regulator
MNVRSPSDLRAAAVIRDRAMALFAESGMAKVTVRQIASAAGVSPALVIHHFGSKDGLKNAVDERVVTVVDDMIADLRRLEDKGGSAILARSFAGRLEREPALADYVGRLLVDDGPAGDALFQHLFQTTLSGVRRLVDAGVVREPADEAARAAFLLVNDLAALLLRRHVEQAIGTDPLSKEGLTRWTAVVVDTYANGLFAVPPGGAEPEQAHVPRRRRT